MTPLEALRTFGGSEAGTPGGSATVVLDYGKVFSNIWRFVAPDRRGRFSWPLRIVLVERGDLMGFGDFAYARNLRAVDWALIMCAALSADRRVLPEVCILECGKRTSSTQRCIEMLAALKRRGVRVPVYLFEARDVGQIDSLLGTIAREAQASAPLTPQEQETLSACWTSELASADSRGGSHELNNSLAPMALSAGNAMLGRRLIACVPHSTPLRRALWTAFDILAMGDKPLRAAPGLVQRFEAVLLDDQASQGWAALLNWVLCPDGDRAVRTHEHPDFLLRKLEERWQDARACGVHGRFSFWLQDPARPEVLFLDARLFASQHREAEHAFLQRLVGTGSESGLVERMGFAVSPAHARAGRGIASPEIKQLREWLASVDPRTGGWQESERYLQALTVLPRLVAAFDCTYPIVLFSSTAQRTVLESLADFPSIQTGLQKPRFGAYASRDVAYSFNRALEAALARCTRLLQAREACKELLRRKPVGVAGGRKKKYVEIFTDESGTDESGHFVISALAVVYSTATDKRGAEACNVALRSSVVTYESLLPNGALGPRSANFTWRTGAANHIPKRAGNDQRTWLAFRNGTADLLNFAGSAPGIDLIVGTGVYMTSPPTSDFGTDAAFLAMTVDALEVLICDLLAEPRHLQLSIFIGNRRRYVLAGRNASTTRSGFFKLQTEYRERYGIKLEHDAADVISGAYKPHYQSVSKETAVRLWAELVFRNPVLKSIVPQICRGEAMNTTGATRELHNLADLLASSWNSTFLFRKRKLKHSDDWLARINVHRVRLTSTARGSALEHARNSRNAFALGSDAVTTCIVEAALATLLEPAQSANGSSSAICHVTRGAAELCEKCDPVDYYRAAMQLAAHREFVNLQERQPVLPIIPSDSIPAN